MLTGEKAVVDNVVMSQHHSFREAGSTGSILHIDHIVATHAFFDGIQFIVVYILAQQQQFGVLYIPRYFS